jgi:hypothetical protein
MTKTRTRRTHRRMRRQQKSRRRNMRRRCGGAWRVQPGTFENVHLYKNSMANNSLPQNLSENFNKNGEITNDQLNRALDATRENLTTPPFEITNIPGITHALRHGHSLDFFAGDELMGTILISESETGDRGDKPAWMRPYQHVRR